MATRKRKKLSNTTKLFIVIAIVLVIIFISGGMPQTAKFMGSITPAAAYPLTVKVTGSGYISTGIEKIPGTGCGEDGSLCTWYSCNLGSTSSTCIWNLNGRIILQGIAGKDNSMTWVSGCDSVASAQCTINNLNSARTTIATFYTSCTSNLQCARASGGPYCCNSKCASTPCGGGGGGGKGGVLI